MTAALAARPAQMAQPGLSNEAEPAAVPGPAAATNSAISDVHGSHEGIQKTKKR